MNLVLRWTIYVSMLVVLVPLADAGSDAWSKRGHFVSVSYHEEVKRGRVYKVFDYTMKLPCFFTAPGNSPCNRGAMRKKGKGRVIPITNPEQLENVIPKQDPIYDSSGRFLQQVGS